MKVNMLELHLKTESMLKGLEDKVKELFFDADYLDGIKTKQHFLIFLEEEGEFYDQKVVETIKYLLEEM